MASDTRSTPHHHLLALVCAAAAAGSAFAQSDACFGPPPPIEGLAAEAAASAPVATGKFKLIAQQCPNLAAPSAGKAAAQLDLYNAPPVAVTLPTEAAAPAAAASAAPAPYTPPDKNAARVLSLAPTLTAAARAYDIDPLLLHAIAHIESRHNAQAVSKVGAKGVMQMMPSTAKRFGVSVADDSALFNADTNLRASAAYLRTLRSRYGDDLQLVLAAYNAGEGAVDKHGGIPPYPETQAYVRDVLAVYRRLTESFKVSDSGTLIARAPAEASTERAKRVPSAAAGAYSSQKENQ